MEQLDKDYHDAIQRTILTRMPSGQNTSQRLQETKQ